MLLAPRRAVALALTLAPLLALAHLGCGENTCLDGGCTSGGSPTGTTSSTGGAGTGGTGGTPTGTFPCKGVECTRPVEYCHVQQDVIDPDVGTCLPLPQPCNASAPACACFDGLLLPECACSVTDDGDFAVFCAPTD